MKEIYQAFRGAGVKEMEAIKVTDSFVDIISRFEKESAETKVRFEKESAETKVRFEKESAKTRGAIKTNRVYDGIIIAFLIAFAINILLSVF